MALCVVINNPDGACGILKLPQKWREEYARWTATNGLFNGIDPIAMTEEEYTAFVVYKDVPQGVQARVCDEADIPSDRTFREAWTDANPTPTVDVDMVKARGIWRDKMREARTPKMGQLDVDFMRGVESNDTAAQAAAAQAKQALRDVTADPAIDTAQTPEELKLVWPSILQ